MIVNGRKDEAGIFTFENKKPLKNWKIKRSPYLERVKKKTRKIRSNPQFGCFSKYKVKMLRFRDDFDTLPYEILIRIFEFIPVKDVFMKLKFVCKEFYQVIRMDNIYFKICMKNRHRLRRIHENERRRRLIGIPEENYHSQVFQLFVVPYIQRKRSKLWGRFKNEEIKPHQLVLLKLFVTPDMFPSKASKSKPFHSSPGSSKSKNKTKTKKKVTRKKKNRKRKTQSKSVINRRINDKNRNFNIYGILRNEFDSEMNPFFKHQEVLVVPYHPSLEFLISNFNLTVRKLEEWRYGDIDVVVFPSSKFHHLRDYVQTIRPIMLDPRLKCPHLQMTSEVGRWIAHGQKKTIVCQSCGVEMVRALDCRRDNCEDCTTHHSVLTKPKGRKRVIGEGN